ncbi:MAG: sigma 54-interacting transcriptional regulator [Lachnospiraceae bacterium]
MSRIDKVYRGLCQYHPEQGITAGDLARQLDISRANCSFDLNRLCEDGKAEKRGSKPVYYFPCRQTAPEKTAEENPFITFMQRNPSLAKCGDLAKAAVLYPPNGMNMLLLGETGVGKSMFAEIVYNFACSLGRITTANSFVAFNCADYANNPQLILAQLFGAIKGAYTGAERDRKGLFETAEGGILFLDEVHRLPVEGQEMLFTYMDRGVFRRLGETASERQANVMLICATTENPNSALLQTFLRRLAVIIQLPSLAERSLEERQNLIALFFSQEAQRLSETIRVSVNSLRALLSYHCPGNIGQLSSDIRLLCAKAYADFISGDAKEIRITSFSLPPHIRNGFLNERSRRDLWNRFGALQSCFYFQADGTLPDFESDNNTNIYEVMERQTSDMKRVGLSDADIHTEIGNLLERYYKHLGTEGRDEAALERLVGPEIKATTDKLLETAGRAVGREFSANVRLALAMHIFNTLKRVEERRPIKHPNLEKLKKGYPDEWNAAVKCMDILQNDFSIHLPMDEVAFLTLFFSPETFGVVKKHPVQLIVVAHGIGTATGMAGTANHLLGLDMAIGFDMPMNENPDKVYGRVKDYLDAHPDIKEVFLLVDMGSLYNFASDLEQELAIKAKAIALVSTLHVFEAGRRAALGHSLAEVYQMTKNINDHHLADESVEKAAPVPPKLFVITACTTGKGSADMLMQRLETHLDLASCSCWIIPLAIADQEAFSESAKELGTQGRIVAVVSGFQTGLAVPHFSLSAILDGSGIVALQKRLNWESLRFRLIDTISDLLDELDAAAAIESTHDMMSKLVVSLDADLTEEMMVGILSHLLFMLNRLKKGEIAPLYPNKEILHQKYPGVVSQVAKACDALGRRFKVQIPDDEICYVAAFFTREKMFQTPVTWS